MESKLRQMVEDELAASAAAVAAVHADASYRERLVETAHLFVDRLRAGKTLLFAGNGGSAADAQHIAGELVSRFHFDRPGLAAIALSTDTSILTCIGNDYGFERLFARQVEAIGRPGDVFVGISTSGNSPNILRAIESAKERGLTVVGLGGRSGGKMGPMCDIFLGAPADKTPRIQECHLVSYHLLCALVESMMFGDLRPQTA